MPPAFEELASVAHALAPRSAVVLGSGLGGVAGAFREAASVAFGDVPGLVPATVHGHKGRIAVACWNDAPVLLCIGRLHFYEGHAREVVTGAVRAVASLGARRLILTNAAGGIHPTLEPGSLMAISGQIPLIGRNAWKPLALGYGVRSPYSPRLLEVMPELHHGVYAALTGPCYETPAEIRALAACGADAVGMSTAVEAEAGAELGMEVAAVSCITNRAAGLSAGPLDHSEVLVAASLAEKRLAKLLGRLISMPPG
jgi:purine-nucleoside phosphorylase